MAENEEDDYMGDLSHFLPPGASSLPSKRASNKPEVPNKKRKVFNWHERKKLKREQKQIEEDQKTLVNLESAIPESNIGFKMLKQMGYTPGSALGKEGSGRSEPVGLEIRRGRAGIGKEDDKVEKMRKEMEKAKRDRRTEEELMETFGSHLKEQWKDKRIVSNFHKADAVLAQLENREVVTEKKEEEDVGKDEEEEEEEPITEEITSQDKTTQTENENTIEEIIKAMNLLCAKVENMDKELQQIKSQQHDYKNAELSRSEDLKIPELQGDVGEDNVIPVVQLE